MFNKLEQVAKALEPVTPVLKCRMSQALEPKHVGTDVRMCAVESITVSNCSCPNRLYMCVCVYSISCVVHSTCSL